MALALTTGHGGGSSLRTVLVNLETNGVVDLLPDREASTVAAWLRGGPASRSSPAIMRVSMPTASATVPQVPSSRRSMPHLLRNLGEAIQALGDRHNAAVRRAAQHVRSHLSDPCARCRISGALCSDPDRHPAGKAAELRGIFALDYCDRKALSFATTTNGIREGLVWGFDGGRGRASFWLHQPIIRCP